ncbi:MAG: NUDIX hydrolase [Sphingomonadaceae bacterium]
MQDSERVEAIPAATLVIFRQSANHNGPPELLMVERSKNMTFAGGAAVFPGGRVDPADRELARSLRPVADQDDMTARIAAIRETLEETGLVVGLEGEEVNARTAAEARSMLQQQESLAPVLEHFGWQIRFEDIVPFARWLPRGLKHSRIFDTRFYLADLGTGDVSLDADQTETTRLFWTSASDALKRAEQNNLKIIFPTLRNLERLGQFRTFAEARAHAAEYEVQPITPRVVVEDGKKWLTIPDNAGYPVSREPFTSAMRA